MIVHDAQNYNEKFYPLLKFQTGSDLSELIDNRENYGLASDQNGQFSPYSFIRWLMPSNHFQPSAVQQAKALKNRINDWTEFLENESWERLKQPSGLKPLRPIVRELFQEQKTRLLRFKIEEKGLNTPKLEKALDNLDRVIYRILTTKQEIAAPRFPFPAIDAKNFDWQKRALPLLKHKPLPLFIHAAASQAPTIKQSPTPPSTPDEQASIPYEKFQKLQQRFKRELEIKLLQEKFKKITPQSESSWQIDLYEAFANLESYDEIEAVSSVLTPEHARALLSFNEIYEKADYYKISLMTSKLSLSRLHDVLLSLKEDELIKLNKIFKSLPELVKQRFNENLQELFEEAINLCNGKKEEIDFLANEFRFKIPWHTITKTDLQQVQTLWDDVNNHSTTVHRLAILLAGTITCPVREKDLHDLDNEYRLHLSRLSEPKSSEEKCADSRFEASSLQHKNVGGGIYQIIYGYVFEEAQVDDDSDAIDIFGNWSMTSPKYYYDTGLFPNLSWEEVKAISKDISSIHHLAEINLRKLGIEITLDWKRLKIFNRGMLKDYLAQPEIRAILQDDMQPAKKIFPAWGLKTPQDLRRWGLLGCVTDEEFEELKDNPKKLDSLVEAFLESINVRLIKDWKKLSIHHKRALKEFLEEKSPK